MTISLRTLLQEIEFREPATVPELAIRGVTDDSRRVEPGYLFVAVKGQQADGHDFLDQAVLQGAVAAVGEADIELDVPYVRVPDSRRALAQIAAAWHGHPARQLVMIGITGTDGKTTTANLLQQILRQADLPTGMITTVNAVIGDKVLDTGFHVTTPPALQVQGYLAQMVDAGLSHCIIEATSHGLAQRRVDACEFDLAVVTNITHEHLDYHGSHEAYQQAKRRLFRSLENTAPKADAPAPTAILNLDDSSYDYLSEDIDVRQVSYGRSQNADVRATEIVEDERGARFKVRGSEYELELQTELLGGYNVSNCLAAFTCAVQGLGVSPETAAAGIAALHGIPGRMEIIDLGQPFTAIVDFAHTPNALERALNSARRMTEGRLIAVFGSAGLRDREKRRLMAETSARLADVTILTAEDPRTESLSAILEEMLQAAQGAGAVEGESVFRVPDRGDALRRAVEMARPDDVVIACGKGHEQSMCFGETEYPWDDRQALRAALAERLGVDGPEMPTLPTSQDEPSI
ncbi:MAG: UDP-N-acetylmuramoyl-L-alanyl-D-glutamate--2,6-diaminopimelate ligase [Anaerolineales bacterium]|nr:UDP-N-acetylmuramoyl-L-alanyl-D-glutamate--2,6-diaminopimelate ligase [Anaerolineales bacterium]